MSADSSGNGNVFYVDGELVDISNAHWQHLPTELLKALLVQRQASDEALGAAVERPACGSGNAHGAYNTSLHVFALFLILFLSTAACAFPIIVKRFPSLSVPHSVLFVSRHFGTGVLLATAFVHLLPTAFVSLTDPCLPPFWNTTYRPMPGAIAMIAVIAVVGIEMFFASRGAGHTHGGDFEALVDPHLSSDPSHWRQGSSSNSMNRFKRTSFERPPDLQLAGEPIGEGETDTLVAHRSPSTAQPSPLPPLSPHSKRDEADVEAADSDSDLELDELDPQPDTSASHARNGPYQPINNSKARQTSHPSAQKDLHVVSGLNSHHQQQQKLLLQCLLLEAGILFHSVFIGMALSVSTGPAFIVFLLAISFHQTFEGLALGARISAITFPESSPKPWLMALAFGATTPFGQAIGLGVRHLYDPQGQVGLIVVGVTNAISSGLLLFAGLVGLIAEDFLSDESYVILTGKRRLKACASVVTGAVLMALVGAFA